MRIGVPVQTAVVEALHVVPAADVVTNVHVRDVVGNKEDGQATDSSLEVHSLMSFLKGALLLSTVPAADATANSFLRDVVGNKADAAQTTVGTTRSIIAYVKGVLNALATHVSALGTHDGKLDTVDGYHGVPTADVTTNAHMRDVVGNKEDTLDFGAASTTKSLMAKVKGTQSVLSAPTPDSTASAKMRDVVGDKADTEQATVVDTASVMRYMKALIQELAQRGTAQMASAMTATNTPSDVVNITDKGVLTGISQHSEGADPGRIIVTIDGVEIFALGQFCYDSQAASLAFNHRFNTSLLVEHANVGASVEINTQVAYTID